MSVDAEVPAGIRSGVVYWTTANADYHQSGYYLLGPKLMAQRSLEVSEKDLEDYTWLKECHAMRSIYTALCKCAYVLGDLALTASRTKSNLHSNAVFRRAYVGKVRHHDSYIFPLYNGRGDPWRCLLCSVEARPLFLVSFSAYPPAPLTEVPRYSCTFFPLVPRGSLTDTGSSLSDLATPLFICRASRWIQCMDAVF